MSKARKSYIVIGSSAAGMAAAVKLRAGDPDAVIICITQSQEMPYNTCLLADYLSEGVKPHGLMTRSQEFLEEKDIILMRNSTVFEINRERKEIHITIGDRMDGNVTIFPYDKLFIGTGTRPARPPIGWFPLTQEEIFTSDSLVCNHLSTFHTLKDTESIQNLIRDIKPKTATVIGGGLSGVECADALTERGISVTLIERNTQLLPGLLTTRGSEKLTELITQAGTTICTGVSVERFLMKRERKQFLSPETGHLTVGTKFTITGSVLDNRDEIYSDLIICALGGKPNTELVKRAGITVNSETNAIETNQFMQTNDPDIYAGGDIAQVTNRLTGEPIRSGAWPDAVQQGMIAGTHIASPEKNRSYPGIIPILSSHFYGIQFVSCGPITSPPADALTKEVIGENSVHTYCFLPLKSEETEEQEKREIVYRLIGFMQVGELRDVGRLRRLATERTPLNADEIEALVSGTNDS